MEVFRGPTRRFLARVMLPALIALLIIAGAGPFAIAEESAPGQEAKQLWFDDLQEPIELNDATAEILLRHVASLDASSDQSDKLPDVIGKDRQPRLVFLSASDGTSKARVVLGRGEGLLAAVNDAVEQLAAMTWEHAPVWFKLDVVGQTVSLPEADLDYSLDHDRSLYGLAFEEQSGLAFLPDQLMIDRLVDRSQTVDLNAMVQFLKQQGLDAGVLRELFQPVNHPLFRFSTQSYFWSQQAGLVPLYRGHRIVEDFDLHDLVDAVQRGGDYLSRAVQEDGTFIYHYDPVADEDVNHYNIVRHAGSLYSMYELYEQTRDPELLAAADRACDYLLAQAKPAKLGDLDALCIVTDDDFQLGSNSLAAVALAKRIEATGEDRYQEALRKLTQWILSTQHEDGEFGIHKMVFSERRVVPFVSIYYPGEALLALTRMYRVDGDEKWLDAAEKGANWLISVRDGDLKDEELIHDHWLLYALADLYQQRPSPLYLEHIRRLCRAISAIQHRDPDEADWHGGYYFPPRSTPVATRNEGLASAYQVLKQAGDEELAAEVLTAIRHGIRFQLQTQYDPPSAMHVPDPPYVMGGFRGSLTDFTLRNDFTQHNISSMLRLMAILSDANASEK